MNSADDHLLAGAYALGALDQAEQIDFEIHLSRCAACRAEVAELTETAALLAAASPVPVVDSLLDRVLAEVRETPQLPPMARDRIRDGHRLTAPINGRRRPPRRSRPAIGARRLLAVAAAVALVILAGAAVTRVATQRSQAAEIAAVVDDPATQHHDLRGDGAGDVSVHVQPGTGRAVVEARDLPALDPAKTYELWFIGGGEPHRAVTFDPDDAGTAQVGFAAPVTDPDGFGVTVEPAGGSDAPTSPILLRAET